MLILGLDPGSRHTGYGLVESGAGGVRAVAHGRLTPPRGAPLAARLHHLATQLAALLERWRPQAAVLEAPFHGRSSRSLIVLAQARGALLAALAAHPLEILEYSPAQVKMAVTGHGRADKDQVARMVRILLSMEEEGVSRDASDALALAICGAHRYRMDRMAEGAASGGPEAAPGGRKGGP